MKDVIETAALFTGFSAICGGLLGSFYYMTTAILAPAAAYLAAHAVSFEVAARTVG